jgi:hypothetical protein
MLDLLSLVAILVLLFVALRDRRLEYSRPLAIGAGLLFAAFILLPRLFLGAAHNDDRLAPYFLAVALLAIRPAALASAVFVRMLSLTVLAFFIVRIGAGTASAAMYSLSMEAEAEALDHIPRGAKVAAFVGIGCHGEWARARLEHLPSLAIVRKEAFANNQWTVAGSHLLRVKPPWTRHVDPSHIVALPQCKEGLIEDGLAAVTPAKFDYVWLIQPPPHDPSLTRGWTPVWRKGGSSLFRLGPPAVTVP